MALRQIFSLVKKLLVEPINFNIILLAFGYDLNITM